MTSSLQRFSLASCLALPLVFASSQSRADVPPEPESCDSKNAGDACELDDGKAGVCTARTCSRLSYGAPPMDERGRGGPSSGPRTVEYSCVKCGPVPAKSEPSDKKAAEAKPPSDAKAADAKAAGAKASDAKAAGAKAADAKAAEAKPAAPAKSESMCTVNPDSEHPWGALVVLVGGIVGLRRRS